MLPDDVERILFTDPDSEDTDRDGIDDFLAAVHFRYSSPFSTPNEGAPAPALAQELNPVPTEHAARVVLSEREDPTGFPAIWVHYLFRFAGSTFPQIDVFDMWVDQAGTPIALHNAFLGQSEIDVRATSAGTLLRFSMRLGLERDFVSLRTTPMTFGLTMVLQGQTIHTGAMLVEIDDHAATVTPIAADDVVVLGLNSVETLQNPFWTRNRVCTMSVSVLSTSRYGHLCEFNRSNCRPASNLRCPPSCTNTSGQLFFIPNGLPVVMGGN